jgi:putrescine transport system substrate-binding protein
MISRTFLRNLKLHVVGAGLLAAGLSTALPAAADTPTLNVYNWSDYIGPNVISGFEKATGIKVNYDTYDGNETLEAKLSTGNSGYDIAVPTLSPFLARGIQGGLYQKIDKSKLKNWGNLDPELLARMAKFDPGNDYAIPWVSAIDGIAVNVEAVKKAFPDAPLDSWALMMKPENLAKFASCGVEFLDSPTDVLPVALLVLGLDPNSMSTDDLKKATDLMLKLRPSIRKFDSSGYINDIAGGDACIAFGWSTDVALASQRAKDAHKPYTIKFIIPKEGSVGYIDTVAIPAGAPHYAAALAWLDYVMRPEVAADTANLLNGRTGVLPARKLMKPEFANDPGIFPPPEVAKTLFDVTSSSPDYDRARNRAWTQIKTGQ